MPTYDNGFDVYVRHTLHGDHFGPWATAFVQIEAKYYHDQQYTSEEIVDEIYQTFDYRCHHEHDCCACWMSDIDNLVQIGKWTWSATISSAMNV